MKRAVFLDRDGVINNTFFRDGKTRAPSTVEQFSFLPGVREAAQALKNAGFVLIVVTNQPDVVRGWQKREVVEAMNDIVRRELDVEDILVCWHDDHHGCECRKPLPGMILEAADTWQISLESSFMVGDRESDVAAGHAAGCRTFLVSSDPHPNCRPDWVVGSLLEATKIILTS